MKLILLFLIAFIQANAAETQPQPKYFEDSDLIPQSHETTTQPQNESGNPKQYFEDHEEKHKDQKKPTETTHQEESSNEQTSLNDKKSDRAYYEDRLQEIESKKTNWYKVGMISLLSGLPAFTIGITWLVYHFHCGREICANPNFPNRHPAQDACTGHKCIHTQHGCVYSSYTYTCDKCFSNPQGVGSYTDPTVIYKPDCEDNYFIATWAQVSLAGLGLMYAGATALSKPILKQYYRWRLRNTPKDKAQTPSVTAKKCEV